jgi:hypothetical protein
VVPLTDTTTVSQFIVKRQVETPAEPHAGAACPAVHTALQMGVVLVKIEVVVVVAMVMVLSPTTEVVVVVAMKVVDVVVICVV